MLLRGLSSWQQEGVKSAWREACLTTQACKSPAFKAVMLMLPCLTAQTSLPSTRLLSSS